MNFNNDTDHFDQHFLIDKSIIDTFIKSANFNKNDTVVEIGPGKGNITKLIANKVKELYCIELDGRLKPYLDEISTSKKNVKIIYSNALNTDIPKCNKIITSLPYSIIEPFMNKMIKTDFDELFMITGSRFANSVEQKEITKLSLLTNCFFEFNKIMDIVPESFNPAPRTMSSMISIKHKIDKTNDIYSFFKQMYLLNHKKIKNAIIESLIKTKHCLTQREAREIINELNISDEILETKFEVCNNEQLFTLYNEISKIHK